MLPPSASLLQQNQPQPQMDQRETTKSTICFKFIYWCQQLVSCDHPSLSHCSAVRPHVFTAALENSFGSTKPKVFTCTSPLVTAHGIFSPYCMLQPLTLCSLHNRIRLRLSDSVRPRNCSLHRQRGPLFLCKTHPITPSRQSRDQFIMPWTSQLGL